MKINVKPSVAVIATPDLNMVRAKAVIEEWGHEVEEWDPLGDSWQDGQQAEVICEIGGRTCYQSFTRRRPGGTAEYLRHIIESGHGSVLEHASFTFLIWGISRACSHELVRHRAGWAYSQLSQRYVDESVAEYVEPDVIANDPQLHEVWLEAVRHAHASYVRLAELLNQKLSDPAAAVAAGLPADADRTTRRKAARQAARSVLPNATETKLQVTVNLRALRHFFEQRCSPAADPEIRALGNVMFEKCVRMCPNVFADYEVISKLPDGSFAVRTQYPKV
jgi:thymidylate synthase (FAD)